MHVCDNSAQTIFRQAKMKVDQETTMKSLITAILLLSTLTSTALTQEKELPPAQAEIVNAERAFARMCVERGIRDSFIAYFADDGIGFAPHPHKVKETLSQRPAPATRPPFVLNWAPVYGDISAYFPRSLDERQVRFMDSSRGRDKVLFGTNGLGLKACIEQFNALPIKDETKQRVLRDNAITFLKLE